MRFRVNNMQFDRTKKAQKEVKMLKVVLVQRDHMTKITSGFESDRYCK